MGKKALIVVDVQNDFCNNGALAVPGAEEILPVVKEMIALFQKDSNAFVVFTQDWHPRDHSSFQLNSSGGIWPVHCVQHTKGAALHLMITEIPDKIIRKGQNREVDSYSAFFDNDRLYQTELDKYLREQSVNVVFVLGLATDYCVKFTALDAMEQKYQTYLIENGCRGVNIHSDDSRLAVEEMRKNGVVIIQSEEVPSFIFSETEIFW
jgi:nicotinamidase/pyrazinamidase